MDKKAKDLPIWGQNFPEKGRQRWKEFSLVHKSHNYSKTKIKEAPGRHLKMSAESF